MTPKRFGPLVRWLRKRRGWSLDVLAEKTGTRKGYLSTVENELTNPPSVRIVRRMASIFRVSARAMLILSLEPKMPVEIRPLFRKALWKYVEVK